jgi:hypothetical protein
MVQTPTQLLILETFLQLPETKHSGYEKAAVLRRVDRFLKRINLKDGVTS